MDILDLAEQCQQEAWKIGELAERLSFTTGCHNQ